MVVRFGGIALVCLIGLPVSQAAAQAVYPYPPRVAVVPYPDDPPPGYEYRALRHYERRLPPGYDDDVVVIDRRGRRVYFSDEVYPVRPYVRRYVVPGAYPDNDAPPPRPFFRAPDDRRAALPPAAEPQSSTPMQSEPQAVERRSSLGPADAAESGTPVNLPPRLRRQIVAYPTKEPAGSIIIDTRNTHLYYVLGHGQAVRYGIGVGREGFTWSGREKVSRVAEWPDWYPPKEMIERQPYLPRMMAGGPGNPLGARALYLGNTLYRIHGTSEPGTIGHYVSSGCIRLLNEDIEDLYRRVHVGTRVVVLRGGTPPATASVRR